MLVNAATSNVARMLRESEPFANCLRCFHRLYQADRAEAVQLFTEISAFLDSLSPP
jgi:hypothetical protein